MWRWFLLVAAVAACDTLTTLPCNVSIKTCYIFPNVCNAMAIIYHGYGSGWTFVFVLFNVTNTTLPRCLQTNSGTLAPFCTAPETIPAATSAEFVLTTSVGIFDNDVTFTVLPQAANLSAYIFLPPSTLNATQYVLRIRGTSFSSFNIGFISAYPVVAGILYTGGAGTLNITNALFYQVSVPVVVKTPNVDVHITMCLMYTAGVAAINSIPIIAVINSARNSSQISGAIPQMVVVDYTTPVIGISSPVQLFNVSTIIPFTLLMPPETTCEMPKLPTIHASTLEMVWQIGACAAAAIIIIMLIRRHYKNIHKNQ